MTNWETVSGTTALQLAERGKIARPGTFSAAAIKWTAPGKAPSSLRITGTVKCGYCGRSSGFSLDAMTGRVPCAGCGATYNLFNADQAIDGKDGRVIVASIYSHREGTGLILPELDITDVANDESSTVDERTTTCRVLSMWDCGDRNKVKAFVDAGGDINARGENQWTLLHYAAFKDYAEAVRNLLDFGADPNLPVLSGGSKRTVDIVRGNPSQPHSSEIVTMLTSGRKPRPRNQSPPPGGGSPGNKSGTPGKRWWEFWK